MSEGNLLSEILARVGQLSPDEKKEAVRLAQEGTKGQVWIPNSGPQTAAFFCAADVLLYGGQGGGGKSSLLAGLALTQHKRSLLMRFQYTDLGALMEHVVEVAGTRKGLNSQPPAQFKWDGRIIDFGAAATMDRAQTWQGNPHDFIGIDETTQFQEAVVRFVLGWNRAADESLDRKSTQRVRAVLASNPPLTPEGEWVIGMFRPWLDPTHPNPAQHGELRYFVTDPDGKDLEVDGPDDIREWDGKTYIPKSRTFIPAALKDNPFLIDTGYQATLDAMPEPMRSAVRDGNFMAAREDDPWQVIPVKWVWDAQKRWTEKPPEGVPQCAIGVDIAQGGVDETVLAKRHDGWFAPMVRVPGRETPDGPSVAGLVISHRRGMAEIVIDMGGGYGGSALDHLKANDIPVLAYKGAEGSKERTKDRSLGFVNRRTAAYWKFREALDPSQPGGSPIALPDDPKLLSDLTAPRFEVTPRGIKVEKKEDVVKRLGRSTDAGDAVVMAWYGGKTAANFKGGFPRGGHQPKVIMSYEKRRR